MSLKELALRIPKLLRDEILTENYIANAVSIEDNVYMKYLWEVWYGYVDPGTDQDITCGYCRNTVIENFQKIQPALIEIHKEEKLLDQI